MDPLRVCPKDKSVPREELDSRKYYAVKRGRRAPIIYREWEFCQEAIHEYPRALYKAFKTLTPALNYLGVSADEVIIVERKVNASVSSSSIEYKKPDQLVSPTSSDASKVESASTNLIIYTDGSCSQIGTSRALAGSGIYIPSLKLEMSCPVPGKQTQNRAELWAVIQALEYARHLPSQVEINLDSTYVMNNIKSNNVDNLDLWSQLLNLLKEVKVIWKKVPAHSGNVGNDRADKLAKHIAMSLKNK